MACDAVPRRRIPNCLLCYSSPRVIVVFTLCPSERGKQRFLKQRDFGACVFGNMSEELY